jgi:hypothetical protein
MVATKMVIMGISYIDEYMSCPALLHTAVTIPIVPLILHTLIFDYDAGLLHPHASFDSYYKKPPDLTRMILLFFALG